MRELPDPIKREMHDDAMYGLSPRSYYSADQMRAYAMQERLIERERCAALCKAERDEFIEKASQNNGRESDFAFGSVNSAERIEFAIRSQAR